MSHPAVERPARDPFIFDDADERVVCGNLLAFYPETSREFGLQIEAALFFSPIGRGVFSAVSSLAARGAPVDTITVTQECRELGTLEAIGGPGEVTNLATAFTGVLSTMPSAVTHALDRLRCNRARRMALEGSEFVAGLINNPSVDVAEIAAAFRHQSERVQECRAGQRRGELPEIVDASELLALDLETPEEIIVGLMHRGAKMVLGGGSKSYKTWILLHLAYCVALGREWLGFETHRGRVLYVNLEIQTGFFAGRLATITKAAGPKVPHSMLDLWNLRGHAADLSRLVPQIVERVAQKYALIIIDPIYKTLGGRDENAAGDITGLLNELERLAVQSGAAVVFGAHFSKGNQAAKESIDRIGGSGVYARDPDTILVLTKHEEEGAFTVESTLRNHAPVEPFVVRWQFPLMQKDGSLDPAKLKVVQGRPKMHTADELFDLLGDRELTYGEWAQEAKEHAGMSKGTFSALKCELFKTKRVFQSKLNQKYSQVGKVKK